MSILLSRRQVEDTQVDLVPGHKHTIRHPHHRCSREAATAAGSGSESGSGRSSCNKLLRTPASLSYSETMDSISSLILAPGVVERSPCVDLCGLAVRVKPRALQDVPMNK